MLENIIMIGMPNSGKSTIGKYVAEKLNMSFIDTDLVIKDREKRALRDIVSEDGLQGFLKIQEDAILNLDLKGFVISTGGSVVYGNNAMNHLKENGKVVFLRIPFELVEKRSMEGRRFARIEGQTIFEMYKERQPLYEMFADIIIECEERGIEEIVNEIIGKFK